MMVNKIKRLEKEENFIYVPVGSGFEIYARCRVCKKYKPIRKLQNHICNQCRYKRRKSKLNNN